MDFGFGFGPWMLVPIAGFFIILVIWTVLWKGLALWHSARRGEQWWFIAIFFINTVGILELIYLFGVAKLKFNQLFTKGTPPQPPIL
jgi:hypothetical protein